jgi:hypothetical protein
MCVRESVCVGERESERKREKRKERERKRGTLKKGLRGT